MASSASAERIINPFNISGSLPVGGRVWSPSSLGTNDFDLLASRTQITSSRSKTPETVEGVDLRRATYGYLFECIDITTVIGVSGLCDLLQSFRITGGMLVSLKPRNRISVVLCGNCSRHRRRAETQINSGGRVPDHS